MNIETAENALLWCGAINYGVLILWFVLFLFPHDWIYRLSSRAFRVSQEQFETINLTAMALFKIAILLFNLVPYVALRLAVGH